MSRRKNLKTKGLWKRKKKTIKILEIPQRHAAVAHQARKKKMKMMMKMEMKMERRMIMKMFQNNKKMTRSKSNSLFKIKKSIRMTHKNK